MLEELFPFKKYSSRFINFTDNFKGLKAMSKIVCRTLLGNHLTRWFFIWYVMSIKHTNYHHIKSGHCILYEKWYRLHRKFLNFYFVFNWINNKGVYLTKHLINTCTFSLILFNIFFILYSWNSLEFKSGNISYKMDAKLKHYFISFYTNITSPNTDNRINNFIQLYN